MENTISSKRITKTVLNNIKNNNLSIIDNISNIDRIKVKHGFQEERVDNNYSYLDEKEEIESKIKLNLNFKTKVILKVFFATLIIFLCLVFKFVYPQIIENKYVINISNEYKKDYSKEDILFFLENIIKKMYANTKFLIPENMAISVVNNYENSFKPYIKDATLKGIVTDLIMEKEQINEENIQNTNDVIEEKKDEVIEEENLNGIGGGEPIEEITNEEASSVSMMDDDVTKILAKNINIIKPVDGTITSLFGAREVIFEDVNPYHTGLDIANVLNTEIKSATLGTVTKTEKNNKYYGNNIEIETDGVTFKYAHLNEILVNVGDKVEQNSIIGKMGSTGMSTGSHLHFEIKIDGRTVDPTYILKF